MVNQQKIVLLIDLDGVCADWYGQIYRELKVIFPNDEIPSVHDLVSYFWEDSFDKKYHTYVDAICEAKGFYRKLTPYVEAQLALQDIEENCLDFIEPFICTKPSSGYEEYLCHSEKIQWVAENLGHFWAKRTILAPDKTLIGVQECTVLVDDHPCITGVNPNPPWIQLLYSQPYNTNVRGVNIFDWGLWNNLKQVLSEDHPSKELLLRRFSEAGIICKL
jgi:hypothetical protein